MKKKEKKKKKKKRQKKRQTPQNRYPEKCNPKYVARIYRGRAGF